MYKKYFWEKLKFFKISAQKKAKCNKSVTNLWYNDTIAKIKCVNELSL